MSVSLSVAAKIAVYTAFRDILGGVSSPAGSIKVVDATNTVLAQVNLGVPCGTVSGAGTLTLTINGRDEEADAGGTAATVQLCDSASAVHLTLPCVAGSSPVQDAAVLSTLTVIEGAPFEITSVVLG